MRIDFSRAKVGEILFAMIVCQSLLGEAHANGLSADKGNTPQRVAYTDDFSGIEKIRPMAMSGEQGLAVVQVDGGPLRAVHVGEKLEGTQAVLKEVLADRIVVSQVEAGRQVQIYWVYKSTTASAAPKIIKISEQPRMSDVKAPPAPRFVRVPLSSTASLSNRKNPTSPINK